MVHKPIVISLVAPIAVAWILMLATLAAISLTNQTLAYSSHHKGHHGSYASFLKRHVVRNTGTAQSGNTANTSSNIKLLTIFGVLVTNLLIIAANSITQPASAFRNVPFGLPFGAPSPYDYCTQHFFGQHKFRNDPFELPFP